MEDDCLGSNPWKCGLVGSGRSGKGTGSDETLLRPQGWLQWTTSMLLFGRVTREHPACTAETRGPAARCLSFCCCDVSEWTFQPPEAERHGKSEETWLQRCSFWVLATSSAAEDRWVEWSVSSLCQSLVSLASLYQFHTTFLFNSCLSSP